MMKTKSVCVLLLVLIMGLFISGCGQDVIESENMLSWRGEFSEDVLQSKIQLYESKCKALHSDGRDIEVSLAKNLENVRISRICPLIKGYNELNLPIYLFVEIEYDKSSGKLNVDTSWWEKTSEPFQTNLYSFLIFGSNENGEEELYYFRVDFSDVCVPEE